MVVPLASLLESRPGVKGGKLCITGTGVTVHRIGVLYSQGSDATEIHERLHGAVPLQGIYAAIAYYLSNRKQIDAEVEAADNELLRLADEARDSGEPI